MFWPGYSVTVRHAWFDGLTASQRLLSCRFMKAVRRLQPVFTSLVPPWDQAMVLEGLKGPPFEPLQGADVKFVSLNAVFLPASAKSVNDIHTLSVHPTRNSI